MKLLPFFAVFGSTLAYPGMGALMSDLHEDLAKRQGTPPGSTELIGDLATLPNSALTPVGVQLKGILQLTILPTDTTSTFTKPGALGSAACTASKCCVWSYISDAMAAAFVTSGQCNALARQAVRLGFHDSGTWQRGQTFGGADGSIMLSGTELSRTDNNGLQNIGARMQTWYNTYHQYGVGMADLIQFGAKLAVRVCPGGPRIRTFVGRVDSSTANPTGLLPNVNSPVPTLISLFANKTIVAGGLVALVGAHTTSRQQFFDPSKALTPQDTTPGLWDNLFYAQTKLPSPPAGTLRFPSDAALSVNSATSGLWTLFSTPNGAAIWNRVRFCVASLLFSPYLCRLSF
jgi:hypothetical protein